MLLLTVVVVFTAVVGVVVVVMLSPRSLFTFVYICLSFEDVECSERFSSHVDDCRMLFV